jgi:hypothetical protein
MSAANYRLEDDLPSVRQVYAYDAMRRAKATFGVRVCTNRQDLIDPHLTRRIQRALLLRPEL